MKTTNSDRAVLDAAHKAWVNMHDLRGKRDRNKRFTYGRQWDDTMRTPSGEIVTERDNAHRCGRTPLTNNMIRQLVKCVVGRFRQTRSEQRLDQSLADVYARNSLHELDARALEEFLISGCSVQRVVSEYRPQGQGVWVDNVNPSRFFVNHLNDPRGWDTEIIGMLHDMSLAEVMMRFSHGSRRRADAISQAYMSAGGESLTPSGFFTAPDGRCRVIEVWTLETVERVNVHDHSTGSFYTLSPDKSAHSARGSALTTKWGMSTLWRCRYFTPTGMLLDSTTSPYRHGSHPFVVKLYPLTDGEIHPFVEDIIDQQKHINRLVTMIDHIMGTSAKGVLLYPRMQKPDDMPWDEVARQWAATDGILPYDPRPGEPTPQQIITNNSNLGAFQLLNLEMKLFEDISGVSDALMGRVGTQ